MKTMKEKKPIKVEPKAWESPEETKRRTRVGLRVDYMLEKRRPFERRINNSLMLYSGQMPDKYNPNVARYVAPYGFIFVEAKTAEEVRAMSEFDIVPVDDENDQWKVDRLKDVMEHIHNKVMWRSKRIQMLRMKNIAGVSIARVGNRTILGKRPIGTKYDEYGRMIEWEDREIPIYDDIFIDIVPPLNFIVDPEASTLNEAMDCGQFHAEHIDVFREAFSDDRFHNVDKVNKGYNDMVGVFEYFNTQTFEWDLYSFPYNGKRHNRAMEEINNWVEIGALALPDDHGMLPFFDYHDNSVFADLQPPNEGIQKTDSGEELAVPYNVRDVETFWTQGVPSVIEDLIELRTAFGRSSYRALDLASQVLLLTASSFSLDEARKWLSGMQVPGGLGKVQPFNLGAGVNIAAMDYALTDIFEQMVMSVGADPRNLTDLGKVQTATQSMIQNETAARRLNLGIAFNEENGETRRGILEVKDAQQYYTNKEVVRLKGDEDEKLLKQFEGDIEYIERGGKKTPVLGKRYRRIRSSSGIQQDGDRMLSGGEKKSFIALPEYIRTSDLDIRVIPARRAGQTDAVLLENTDRYLQRIQGLLPFTQPNGVSEPPLSINDIPLKEVLESYGKLLGSFVPKGKPEDKEESGEDLIEAREQFEATRTPLTAPQPIPQQMNA